MYPLRKLHKYCADKWRNDKHWSCGRWSWYFLISLLYCCWFSSFSWSYAIALSANINGGNFWHSHSQSNYAVTTGISERLPIGIHCHTLHVTISDYVCAKMSAVTHWYRKIKYSDKMSFLHIMEHIRFLNLEVSMGITFHDNENYSHSHLLFTFPFWWLGEFSSKSYGISIATGNSILSTLWLWPFNWPFKLHEN